jgi:hypothetical protein
MSAQMSPDSGQVGVGHPGRPPLRPRPGGGNRPNAGPPRGMVVSRYVVFQSPCPDEKAFVGGKFRAPGGWRTQLLRNHGGGVQFLQRRGGTLRACPSPNLHLPQVNSQPGVRHAQVGLARSFEVAPWPAGPRSLPGRFSKTVPNFPPPGQNLQVRGGGPPPVAKRRKWHQSGCGPRTRRRAIA